MFTHPERVWEAVTYFSNLPVEERITGFCYEHLGTYQTAQLGAWTAAVRGVMTRAGWNGRFLFHEHEQWGTMH